MSAASDEELAVLSRVRALEADLAQAYKAADGFRKRNTAALPTAVPASPLKPQSPTGRSRSPYPSSPTNSKQPTATLGISGKELANPDELDDEYDDDGVPAIAILTTYLSYVLLMMFGYARELFRSFIWADKELKPPPGYAPIVRDFDDFFSRRMYRRCRDCWNRPIDSRPGRTCAVMERSSPDYNKTFQMTGALVPCINLASYNYLGFAEAIPQITENNICAVDRYGVAACASANEGGRTSALTALERETAEFVGKEDACVFAMGFATNFSALPALFCQDTLIISDSLNHASIVAGVRASSGRVKVFPHNNIEALEAIVRSAIVEGQPRTHKKWKRIVFVVEGIYSMEGEVCDLPAIIAVKKKYRCLIYVDEAHSIGALGRNGRGVCEYHDVDPSEVDILMGTYTKSFGSIGGYIAGDRKIVDYVRRRSGALQIGDSLSSAACEQALSSLRVMSGKDGTDLGQRKIAQLAENARFLREGLRKLGFTVFGRGDSPVVPIMLYNPGKVTAFSRECLKRNLAVVVVGYPATPLIEARARFCVSASHTREDLERALKIVDEVGGMCSVRYDKTMYFM